MNGTQCGAYCAAILLLVGGGATQVCAQNPESLPGPVPAVLQGTISFDDDSTAAISYGVAGRIISASSTTNHAAELPVSGHDEPWTGAGPIEMPLLKGTDVAAQPYQALFDSQSASKQSIRSGERPAVISLPGERVRNSPDTPKRVEVRVTGVSGGSIYLDRGHVSGLQPGDKVRLFPPADGIVEATVQSVSSNSSRCMILSVSGRIEIGTRGEVFVPARRLEPEVREPSAPRENVPEHPPWTHPPENWDKSQPLLAPAYSRSPDERERQIHGRLFAQYLHTWNRHYAHNEYSLGRVGASLWMENPFGRGGGLHFDGELHRRGIFLSDGFDEVDVPGRLDRFSYYWGGTDEQPLRVEIGRFLSHEFPEFGFVDGTELVYRTASGHRIGVSVGMLSEPFPNLLTGKDLHVAAFYRWVSDPDETLSTALGFQKTWHTGTPDRDLLIWTADYDPNEHLSVHSTVWADLYDSHDTLKSSTIEITEAVVQPIVRIDPGHGVGAHVSYVRWPQLFYREFSPFVLRQISSDHVLRYGLFTWQALGPHIQLDGRVDQWHDQSGETGTTWEGRVALRDWFIQDGELALAVFGTDGVFSSGPGARISVNHWFPWCFASLSYEFADYGLDRQVGEIHFGNDTKGILQQAIRADLDFTLSSDRSVSVFADYRFGQSQNAIQAGMFFQQRF